MSDGVHQKWATLVGQQAAKAYLTRISNEEPLEVEPGAEPCDGSWMEFIHEECIIDASDPIYPTPSPSCRITRRTCIRWLVGGDLWEVIDDEDTESADTELTFTAGDEDDEEGGGGGGGQEMAVMTRATSSRLKSRIYTMSYHKGHLQQLVDLPRLKVLSHGCMALQHSQAATTIYLIVWAADLLFCIPIPISSPT